MAAAAPQPPSLGSAHTAWLVVDSRSGRVLSARDADALMLPASTLKLFTAAAALQRLKRDFRWHTRLWRDGEALVLEGSGDPTLSAAALARLAAAMPLRVSELRLDTRRIYDAPYGPGWAWDDLTESWCPPLGALGVNENTVAVRFEPALAAGAPPRVASLPADVLHFVVEASTGRPDAADDLRWTRRLGTDVIDVCGVLPQGTVLMDAIPVSDGAAYVARLLLGPAGVKVTRGARSAAASLLAEVISPPLHEAVRHMLKESDNYYAEQMLRTLGQAQDGRPADSGLEAASKELGALGVTPGSYRQVDGSGLSRYNLVSPRQLVTVLRAMVDDGDFLDALPRAGVDGTLSRRFLHSSLRGRMRAKTGSMGGVSTLAGYLFDERGHATIAFALMVNDTLGGASTLKRYEEEVLDGLLTP